MSARVRTVLWGLAVLAAAAAVGLTAVAVTADLETTDRVASVVGAVTSAVALAVSLVVLLRPTTGGTAGPGARVSGGADSVVIGRDAVGSAIGNRSRVQGPPSAAPSGSEGGAGEVTGGPGATVVGRDARDTAIGDDSTRLS